MNKISRPTFNDHEALQNLANNQKVRSYPALLSVVEIIKQGYTQYEAAAGNALSIPQVIIPQTVENYLKAHYKSPPKDIKHLAELRKAIDQHSCPMCGSFHCGTLDHLLPQSDYAAFAVFSLNLVPACKCNTIRNDLLKGTNAGERILHPYFDNCLTERLIKAHFSDLGEAPKTDIRLCVEETHVQHAAISFHFHSIVKRTEITGHFRRMWSKLCRKPSLIVRALKNNPPTLDELQKILRDELDLLDEKYESKNNWDSAFVAGLLDEHVSSWIFSQMQSPGRIPDSPLI